MTPEYIAVESTAPKVADFLTALYPAIEELDYEKDLHLKFFVAGFPGNGRWTIMDPGSAMMQDTTIYNGMQITFKHLEF